MHHDIDQLLFLSCEGVVERATSVPPQRSARSCQSCRTVFSSRHVPPVSSCSTESDTIASMNSPHCHPVKLSFFFLVLWINGFALTARHAISQDHERRHPWMTSRLSGTPDPPLPYTTQPYFDQVHWNAPVYAKAEPGSRRLFVIERAQGPNAAARVFSVEQTKNGLAKELLVEIDQQLVYSLEFAPDYLLSRAVYLFMNGPLGQPQRDNRIVRYRTSERNGSLSFDSETAEEIIRWSSAGHDGGEMAFAKDGMLYISSGDGSSDSDQLLSGQDLSNLCGGVLRIKVVSDQPRYTIPADNPFVGVKDARDELWAFGLRNPWRLTADLKTGQIWVGNNGQDLWETVHLLQRKANYGWSVYEGNHPFYLSRPLGPAPFVPPTIEHHHREARSLTGGIVYYGTKQPLLDGTYVYGDYSTGKIWGAKHDGQRLTFHQELADTQLEIVGFAKSPDGELLVVDIASGLHQLVATPSEAPKAHRFPRDLSTTGLFESTADHRVAPGVTPYSVNASAWNDGLHAERYLAIPGMKQIVFSRKGDWIFPNGSVVMQTLFTPTTDRRRVETRVLLRQENEWLGYSYRWNEAQSDAKLVDANGTVDHFDMSWQRVDDPSLAIHRWNYPSRAECMTCHSRVAEYVCGVRTRQLNRDDQLEQLRQIGLLNLLPDDLLDLEALADPYQESQPLEARVRSYLDVNCAICHVEAGGGNARLELGFHTPLERTNLLDSFPQHATFGLRDARIVVPSEPAHSVLLTRLSRRGRGQMPPLVSNRVDQDAVQLFERWINRLKVSRPFIQQWNLDDLTSSIDSLAALPSHDKGRQVFLQLGCSQCHRLDRQGGGVGPDLGALRDKQSPRDILQAIIEPSLDIKREYATTVIVTQDGKTLQGRIEREDENAVWIHSGTAFDAATKIDKSDIDEQSLSPTSIMPAGLLDTATRDEIVELIRYLSHHPASP